MFKFWLLATIFEVLKLTNDNYNNKQILFVITLSLLMSFPLLFIISIEKNKIKNDFNGNKLKSLIAISMITIITNYFIINLLLNIILKRFNLN